MRGNTIHIPRRRPVKIYINIHFYDEYTKGDIYLFTKIPKANSGAGGLGIDSDATYRIRETRKRDITRKNVESGNISQSGFYTLLYIRIFRLYVNIFHNCSCFNFVSLQKSILESISTPRDRFLTSLN